jgi:hypothetical protein
MGDTKEAFVKKMETELDHWKKQIDEMEAKARAKEAEAEAEKADAAMKNKLYEKVNGLRQAVEDTKSKLQDLLKAGDASWEEMKRDIENAGDDLRKGIDSAISRFK